MTSTGDENMNSNNNEIFNAKAFYRNEDSSPYAEIRPASTKEWELSHAALVVLDESCIVQDDLSSRSAGVTSSDSSLPQDASSVSNNDDVTKSPASFSSGNGGHIQLYDVDTSNFIEEERWEDYCESLEEPLMETQAQLVENSSFEPFSSGPESSRRPRSGSNASMADVQTATHATALDRNNRPEFISIKFFKSTESSKVGIHLLQQDVKYRKQKKNSSKEKTRGFVYISEIEQDGLLGYFVHSNAIKCGDIILSINGKSFVQSTAKKVQEYLQQVKGTICVILHNQRGNPALVSSSIQKPQTNSRVGVWLKNNQGSIVVSRVTADGLFADTLLLPGHRCVEINGTALSSPSHRTLATDAALIIAQAPEFVTVVSKPSNSGFAMVLCSESHSSSKSIKSRVWHSVKSALIGEKSFLALLSTSSNGELAMCGDGVTPTTRATPSTRIRAGA